MTRRLDSPTRFTTQYLVKPSTVFSVSQPLYLPKPLKVLHAFINLIDSIDDGDGVDR